MSVDDWDYEDVRAYCPRCGSENVVVRTSGGYFFVVLCRRCGYKEQEGILEF